MKNVEGATASNGEEPDSETLAEYFRQGWSKTGWHSVRYPD